MDIETQCTGCEKRLTVPAEFAGRSARCPVCNTIYVVPQTSVLETTTAHAPEMASPTPSSADVPPAPETGWCLKTPEGPIYGPVPRAELDRWVREGRVTHDCHLRPEGASDWQPADVEFPALRPPARPSLSEAAAFPSTTGADFRNSFLLPHRGPLILTFGIMGLVIWCPILSVMAWVMGTNDLREIRTGRRDPAGQSLTQAGQMLGLVLSMLWIAAAVITVGIIVFVATIR